MGPRLGRVEYCEKRTVVREFGPASMGPRLGRVEYGFSTVSVPNILRLQWGHA